MKASLPKLIFNIAAALFLSTASYGAYTSPAFNDSILVQKKLSNKYHKVSLYPDALHKVLFFHVNGNNGKVYQLYVFDLDGHLIKQKEIRNKQTAFISDFDKGIYLFDVFCDDERIGNGQLAVR